jgi:hypothetical protein
LAPPRALAQGDKMKNTEDFFTLPWIQQEE